MCVYLSSDTNLEVGREVVAEDTHAAGGDGHGLGEGEGLGELLGDAETRDLGLQQHAESTGHCIFVRKYVHPRGALTWNPDTTTSSVSIDDASIDE